MVHSSVHTLFLSAIGFINTDCIRVGYRLNFIKVSYSSVGPTALKNNSFQHRQSYFFVGYDEYILHALSTNIIQLNSLADRLITLCVHCQHLLALLRHCFLTKVSHVFTHHSPTSQCCIVNHKCNRIFCSMISHLHLTISALHIHQKILILKMVVFICPILPHSAFDIINLLYLITFDDIPLGYRNHIDTSFISLTLHSLITSNPSHNFMHSIP